MTGKWLALAGVLAGLVARAGEVKLADGGKALAEIVVAAKPTKAAKLGALDLAWHLKQITGAEFRIVTDEAAAGANGQDARSTAYRVCVGVSKLTKARREDFGPQQFLVDVGERQMELVGRDAEDDGSRTTLVDDPAKGLWGAGWPGAYDAQGTLYAVYEFLSRDLGVRWIDTTDWGTVLKPRSTLAVTTRTKRGEPWMRYRGGHPVYRRNFTTVAFRPDDPLRREYFDLAWKSSHPNDNVGRPTDKFMRSWLWLVRHRMGGELVKANHSVGILYNRWWKDEATRRPELFAQGYPPLGEGVRPTQPCLSNPEVIDFFVRAARQYFDATNNPAKGSSEAYQTVFAEVRGSKTRFWGEDYFCLEPNDNGSFCLCDKCRAQFEPDRAGDLSQHSSYWFRFVNAVARELKKTHPHKKISTLAYMTHEGVPRGFRLEDNVAVQFCIHCNRLPYTQTYRRQKERLAEWRREYPDAEFGVWHYNCFPYEITDAGKFNAFHGYVAHESADLYRFYREHNVRLGVMNCGWIGDESCYVDAELMFDPTRGADELLDEYFSGFGAAAAPLRAFYELVERRYCDSSLYPAGATHQTVVQAWGALGDEATMAKLAARVAEAEAAPKSDAEAKRFRLWKLANWDYMKAGSDKFRAMEKIPSPVLDAKYVAAADGDPDKVDWAKLPSAGDRFYVRSTTDPSPYGATFKAAHDGKWFYLEIAPRLDPKRLVSLPAIVAWDEIELLVARDRAQPYRWWAASPDGRMMAASFGEVNWRQNVPDVESGPKLFGVRYRCDVSQPDRWVARYAFPLDQLDAKGGFRPGDRFYMNITMCLGRHWTKTSHFGVYVWNPATGPHCTDRMGEVRLEAAPETGGMKLAEDGKALADVVIAERASRAAQFGALDLAWHLKKITGAEFRVVTDAEVGANGQDARSTGSGRCRICVGESRLTRLKERDFARQEFGVEIGESTIELVGRDDTNRTAKVELEFPDGAAPRGKNWPDPYLPQGTMYAVYEFLQRYCGVRWINFSQYGTWIPESRTLTLAPASFRGKPYMPYRGGTFDTAWGWDTYPHWSYWPKSQGWRDWCETAFPGGDRDWRTYDRLWLLRNRIGGELRPACHNVGWLYSRYWDEKSKDFVEKRPDWFCRGCPGRPPQPCFSNPGVVEESVREARAYFDRGGTRWGHNIFCLEPEDNSSFCTCENCRRDFEPGRRAENSEHSTYWFRYVNAVANGIAKTHPGCFISTLAYATHEGLPHGFRIADNVIVYPCPSSNRSYAGNPSFAAQMGRVREWRESNPKMQIGLWLYNCFPLLNASLGGYRCFPGFFAHEAARQYRLFKELDVDGGVFQCGMHGEVSNYMQVQLMVDPLREADEMLDECFRIYGKSGKAMRAFYDIVEDRFSNPAYRPKGGGGGLYVSWGCLGTPAVMKRLGELMAEADAAATTETEKALMKMFRLDVWNWMTEGAAAYQDRASTPVPEWTAVRVAPAGGDASKVDWPALPVRSEKLFRISSGERSPALCNVKMAHDGEWFYLELEEHTDVAKLNVAPKICAFDTWELLLACQLAKPYRYYISGPDGRAMACSYGEVNFRNDVPATESGSALYGGRCTTDRTHSDRWTTRWAMPLKTMLDRPLAPGDAFFLNGVRVVNPRLAQVKAHHDCWTLVSHTNVHVPDRLGTVRLEK